VPPQAYAPLPGVCAPPKRAHPPSRRSRLPLAVRAPLHIRS
jgi:hypothetical protein